MFRIFHTKLLARIIWRKSAFELFLQNIVRCIFRLGKLGQGVQFLSIFIFHSVLLIVSERKKIEYTRQLLNDMYFILSKSNAQLCLFEY
jgi:hypothetical protein